MTPLELTLPAAPPPKVTEVTDVSHVIFSAAGIRMRRSWEAVMVGVAASVTVSVLATAAACPTVKVWFTAEESVLVLGAEIVMVLSSVAAVAPPEPATTSCRLLAEEIAVKFVNLSPAIVSTSPPAKFDVTFSTAVLLLSS